MGLSVRFTPRSLAQLRVLRDRIARDRPMAKRTYQRKRVRYVVRTVW
jgi:hypothetical protein